MISETSRDTFARKKSERAPVSDHGEGRSCPVCGVALVGRQRSACSARCRAAWSRLRRAQSRERRDREVAALLEEALTRLRGGQP